MGWFLILRIGVSDLHHGGGAVGVDGGGTVGFTQTGITAEDMGAAVFAAEDCPLGEYRKAVEGGRSGGADDCIGQYLIIEGDIDTVMITVKGHRLHIDIGVEKLCAADFGIGAGIQQLLASGG